MKIFNLVGLCFVLLSCSNEIKEYKLTLSKRSPSVNEYQSIRSPYSKLENYFLSYGLKNVSEVDSTILVDIKYASIDNFVGLNMYGYIKKAYLQEEVIGMLSKAQAYLKEIDSSKSIMIYDAARPHSVQKIMWDSLKMPFHLKTKFLSNPKNASVHNYGCAVDVTIFDLVSNTPLDMGTKFDDTSTISYPMYESRFLKQDKLNQNQIENRNLLRLVMKKANFRSLPTEWWHFNAFDRNTAKSKFRLIN